MRFGAIVRLVAVLSFSSPLLAHHSYVRIDRDSVVAFEGTVLDFQWRNPHVYIRVGTLDDNGHNVEWEIETGSTPILVHSGWSSDSLAAGDAVSVRAHPERGTNRRYAVLQSLTRSDGTVLRQGLLPSTATETTRDIAGVWKSRLEPGAPIEVLSALFADFMEVPLTPAGRASVETYDHDRDNPTAVCSGYGLLAGLTSPHYLNQIEIREDRVVIRDEWFDAQRTIFTDGRAHPAGAERTRLGHSTGYWDGDTLVVDTRLFAPHRSPYGIGLASGAQKHVVERYTLNPDGRSLSLEVLLEDPEFLAASFSGKLNWDYTPDFEFYRYDCDPEVATRFSLP